MKWTSWRTAGFRSAILATATLALMIVAAAPSEADAAESLRIGYVDVSRAAARSRSIAATVRAAEDQLKVKQEELELQVRDYRRAQEDLIGRRSVLSEDVIRAEERKVEQMRDQIELLRLDIDKRLRKTESEVMGPAVDRILKAVNDVARAQGFHLILRSDVVIYGVDTLDITPLVIQELDRGMAPAQDSGRAN
jgi:outer membrane protein